MEWDPINCQWREVTEDDAISSSSREEEDDTARRNRRMVLLAGYACGAYYMKNYLVK